jgi:hypothetical protein
MTSQHHEDGEGLERAAGNLLEVLLLEHARTCPARVCDCDLDDTVSHAVRSLQSELVSRPTSPALTDAGELLEAAKPFVRHWEPWMDELNDTGQLTIYPRHTLGELRRLRAAISRATRGTDHE